jgi:hypothetical protein
MPTNHPAARIVAGIQSAIGWILIIGGGAVLAIAIAQLNATPSSPQQMIPQQMMGGAPIYLGNYFVVGVSAIAILFGLFIVANGQLIRATTDSADYNREMLVLMRKQVPVETPRLPSDLPTALPPAA